MGLSTKQLSVAWKLGERLASGDETAFQDIGSVVRPIVCERDEGDGVEVIMHIMLGMLPPAVFDAMAHRQFARLGEMAKSRSAIGRDQTEAASIRRLLAPKKSRGD